MTLAKPIPRCILTQLLEAQRLPAATLHRMACAFAERTLPSWEAHHPADRRPHVAIETKRRWLRGEATDAELDTAWHTAWPSQDDPKRYGAPAALLAAWRAADANPDSAALDAAEHASRLVPWDELLLLAAAEMDRDAGLPLRTDYSGSGRPLATPA